MKTKWIVVSALLLSTTALFAQEKEATKPSQELKINLFNLIASKLADVSYEKIINEESSYGMGIAFSLDDESMSLNEYRSFSLTPYYRQFFSNKHAQGFFMEVFGMLHHSKEIWDAKKFTDFAVGLSAGAKFISRRGFVGEVYVGLGRDLLGNSKLEMVGRGGISLGYRF
ncbi:MAG: DUF3575 domain-containing protein [Lutibacter sp.]|jgi:hypothetical protein|nr:DUF3575 domain-containing protein [Lutibacter sp.]